jgi:hypothetical protein
MSLTLLRSPFDHRWNKLARTPKVVPAPEVSVGATQAFHVCFTEIKQVPLPKGLLIQADKKECKVHASLSATLFHTKSKSFFGSTWTGRGLDITKAATRSGKVRAAVPLRPTRPPAP